MLFKLDTKRDVPTSLEILALDDESWCYGFLMESPEPIDWKRTTMTVFYTRSLQSGIIQEILKPIKIIGVGLVEPTSVAGGDDPNKEYVDK